MRAHGFRALALALGVALACACPAVAQNPPPGAPSQAPSTHADALQGALALARRAALLDALGALGATGRPALEQAVGSLGLVTATDHPALLAALDQAVSETSRWAAALSADGVQPSRELPQVMGPLTSPDRAAAAAGRPIAASAQIYLNVLDDLFSRDGRPPLGPPEQRPPADPAAIHAGLARLLASPSPPASPTPVPTAPIVEPAAPSLTVFPPALVAAVVALLALGAGLLLWRRRAGSAAAAPASIDQLLEISRRLTSTRGLEEVHRATVREALGLVRASSAALVVRRPAGLEIAAEGMGESLLVAERLGEGLIGRVADTGQPIVQVSATEPAIRNLPTSLAAVPLVGGGAVIAVLVMLRGEQQPFTLEERALLVALAPVAAAAIDSAGHADEAVEGSLTDALTGVGNRRRLEAELPEVLRRAGGLPTSLAMLDVDHFKAVNDTHGHPAGDQVLRAVAALLRDGVRPQGRVFRYGGEEFCIVLAATPLEEALRFAERTRGAIETTPVALPGGASLRVTASLGVAEGANISADDLVARADAALYRAKQGGRNRVEPA